MKGLACNLRISVSVGWVVAWNVLLGIGLWVNGGFTPPLRSPVAQLLAATAFFGTALFSLVIALMPSVSYWALRPGAHVAGIRKDLLFIAFLTAALGLGMTFSFVGGSGV